MFSTAGSSCTSTSFECFQSPLQLILLSLGSLPFRVCLRRLRSLRHLRESAKSARCEHGCVVAASGCTSARGFQRLRGPFSSAMALPGALSKAPT